jgi:hypothetical protein
LENLRDNAPDGRTQGLCSNAVDVLTNRLIVYERHTPSVRSNGVSIYLSHPRMPRNVWRKHFDEYRRNRFSIETQWDELLEAIHSPPAAGPGYHQSTIVDGATR